MQYQQGPPPDQSRGRRGGGSNNCLMACIAALCCCCVAEEGCECWYGRRQQTHTYASRLTLCRTASTAASACFKRPATWPRRRQGGESRALTGDRASYTRLPYCTPCRNRLSFPSLQDGFPVTLPAYCVRCAGATKRLGVNLSPLHSCSPLLILRTPVPMYVCTNETLNVYIQIDEVRF